MKVPGVDYADDDDDDDDDHDFNDASQGRQKNGAAPLVTVKMLMIMQSP